MGCHTWSYRKVKNIDVLKSIIDDSYKFIKDFADTYTKEMYNDYIKSAIEWYESYMDGVNRRDYSYDENDVSYIDEDTKERIFYHQEPYEQHMKNLSKELSAITNVKNIADKSNDIDEVSKLIIDNYDLICNNNSLKYFIQIHNGNIYYCEYDNSNERRQINNPFENKKFFRVYGYPVDQPDEFYLTSPTGINPLGWTDAESLINFLEWYKNTDEGSRLPYTFDENNNLVEGYTETLYKNIRDFFNSFEKDEVLIKFS